MTAARGAAAGVPDAYWSAGAEALFRRLRSGPSGLDPEEAQRRWLRDGPNRLRVQRPPGRFRILFRQFRSPIVLILLFAVGVSFAVRDWTDAGIILVIVLGSAALSARQEFGASSAVERLQAQIAPRAAVLRGGSPRTVPAEQVVPGDVILLSAGSLVPADGVVLEARDCFVDQAALTGETFPVERQSGDVPATAPLAQRTNCVYQGTSVRSGTARALVVRTGGATQFGSIAGRLRLRPPGSAFEQGVRHLGYLLSEVTLLLVLAVFAINVAFRRPVLDSLLFSLALAVGLTPQLLPAIISIALARGSINMSRRGVIVRRLEAIDEFGAMDVLCTDKTGTLTQGAVRLESAADPAGRPSPETLRLAAWNARLETGLANPLDEAILAAAGPATDDVRKLDEIPYDFERKRLSVVVASDAGPLSEAGPLMITKGAVPGLLAACTRIALEGGDVLLDDARRAAVELLFRELLHGAWPHLRRMKTAAPRGSFG